MGNSFRDLVVWQRAMQLTVAVYKLTRAFPREELYGLTNQIRRAAVSMPSNIAEGHGRLNTREFCQFLGIARARISNYRLNLKLHAHWEWETQRYSVKQRLSRTRLAK
jgi:four helix bundle protein